MNGLILRTTKVKDSDAVVDWLLDDDRIVTTYAAHFQSSRAFPNSLELMNVYEVELTQKPNQEMGRLSSAYSVERFGAVLDDLVSYACACAAFEAVSNACPKDAVVVELFSNLLSVIAVMNTAHELSPMCLAWFECFLFYQLGVMPNLELCAKCAGPLGRSTWFQQELGFLCPACAQKQENLPAFVLDGIRRLRYQSLRTTVQNALARDDEAKRKRVLEPVLRFLVAVMNDCSPICRLKAHRLMAEMAFGLRDWV